MADGGGGGASARAQEHTRFVGVQKDSNTSRRAGHLWAAKDTLDGFSSSPATVLRTHTRAEAAAARDLAVMWRKMHCRGEPQPACCACLRSLAIAGKQPALCVIEFSAQTGPACPCRPPCREMERPEG